MNPTDQELETILSQAPRPRPPGDLKAGLLDQLQRNGLPADQKPRSRPGQSAPTLSWQRWLNAWWPMVATASLTLACLGLMAVQRAEIRDLTESLAALKQQRAAAVAREQPPAPTSAKPAQLDERQDLKRLQQTVRELQGQVAELENLKAANQQLRQQLAAAKTTAGGPPEPDQTMQERAWTIRCVNNLKQLGLAARIWAVDHEDRLPPNLVCMSNEIASTKVLICPADTGRQPAVDWTSFTLANSSYEFLAANGTGIEPERVLFRCPIHGSITLCDGSVQSEVAKKPESLVMRDGKLYMSMTRAIPAEMAARYGLTPEAPTTKAQPAPVPAAMDAEMMRRYGLQPAAEPPTNTPPEQTQP